jgi:hypothetical protein
MAGYSRLLLIGALTACAFYLSTPAAPTTQDQQSEPLRPQRVAGWCDLFASPTGSDREGRGTRLSPFASAARLDRSLRPGQTGCLRGGTYGDVNTRQQFSQDGTSQGQITITSYPGETAKLIGWVDIEASYTTLSHLEIDGSNTFYRAHPPGITCRTPVAQGLVIAGHDDVFEYNNYYQSVPSLRSNGIGVGWWGNADSTTIRFNRIHDVGGCDFYDHLIYLGRCNNAQIYDNWMWNDAHGWGVKLDPGPTNARIWNNVIDAAGSGFNFGNSSGSAPTAGNLVWNNVVMNSVGVNNPDIGWSHSGVLVTSPGLASYSTGNQLHDNVSYHNGGGLTNIAGVTTTQLSVSNNTTADPQLSDPSKHDYTPRPKRATDPKRGQGG